MHSRFRFYALIALIALGNSLPAQDEAGADTPAAIGGPTPGKHQLRASPMQVLQHLLVQQNKEISEQKEQIESLSKALSAQEKQITALMERVDISNASITALNGQLIQMTGTLEEIQKGMRSLSASGESAPAPAAPRVSLGSDPLDEPAEVTAARTAADAVAPSSAMAALPATPVGKVHVIAQGETLGVIARKYDTTVAELVRRNNIRDPRKLQIGQSLYIP